MNIPISPWALLLQTHFKVLPSVRQDLNHWRSQAEQIPNPELRKQAISSLETKQFHCEGGSIYGLLAKKDRREAIRFIVAYQTISDYLDNLCDRSRSLDPEDFRSLHESIFHALSPDAELPNYYRFREDRDDGGYLKSLVGLVKPFYRASRITQRLPQPCMNWQAITVIYKFISTSKSKSGFPA